ncbi:hypothetical protein NAG18_05240 [Pseudomonas aeruginosa]|uniref:hypothetical protein n=1 Tax=Pseudomonas aeruginosa TaxID=287 RepID=UPI00102D9020|nr:hypothetical protein [Pseudomonas aeruginosa]MCR3784619.1 hypothetical protein [Pseudomonas aeruginosa]MCS8127358.1 hypothetical protein [Pseudomonas aeruginosa]MCS9140880.1 hypothetical protein [Pseudomonas aeruginosa]MCS9212520.1 hypothetical protein [Pseudomonas aeruginosa]QBF63421.1 hypothetical protein DOM02_23345 [Pseudomonas aeruginosa]
MTVQPISDEQLAELADGCMDSIPCPISALYQLAERLRAAEVDAKRYRWLRDVLRHDEKRWIGAGAWNHANIPPVEFDEAVDSAMERRT